MCWGCQLGDMLAEAESERKKKRLRCHCSQRSQSPRRASWALQIEPKKGQKRLATHHQQQQWQHHHHSCRRLNLNPPTFPLFTLLLAAAHPCAHLELQVSHKICFSTFTSSVPWPSTQCTVGIKLQIACSVEMEKRRIYSRGN